MSRSNNRSASPSMRGLGVPGPPRSLSNMGSLGRVSKIHSLRRNDSGKDRRQYNQGGTGSDIGSKSGITSARNTLSRQGFRPGSLGRKPTLPNKGMAMNIQGRTYNKASNLTSRSGSRLPDFYNNTGGTPRDRLPTRTTPGSLPAVGNKTTISTTTPLTQVQPADEEGVIFAVSQKHPGIPFVYRTQTARMVSPERLNLDRRNMTICPVLEGEEQLRLLNFENNNILKISNLRNLPNLIFLDLYNNQIQEISGLESLSTLRVLMLGKNYIRKIENLESLHKLDVLDLHSNRISRIQNLSHLRDLRVLNLAGNQIDVMENLDGLSSLTELNLRRNGIQTVRKLDNCSALHRLFLSNNRIASFDRLEAVFRLKSLAELTLDGNEVANNRYYREYLLDRIKTLKSLDMRRVTDEERRFSSTVVKNDEKLEKQRREHLLSERNHTISAIESAWAAKYRRSTKDRKGSPRRHVSNAKGYYEVKDRSRLVLYGSALELLSLDGRSFPDKEKIECVEIVYYEISRLGDNLGRLRKFPNMTKLALKSNDIKLFGHLDVLVQCGLKELTILENKVVSIPLFRDYAVYKLTTLNSLNDKPITEEDREKATALFRNITAAREVYMNNTSQYVKDKNTTLTESSKTRKLARHYLDKVVNDVLGIDNKIQKLNQIWPTILGKIVRTTLAELESKPLGISAAGEADNN